MKKILSITAMLAALVLGATAAFAAVTFNPATGTGFVGKGDVQLVYGWNNKQLQENAGSVRFRANSVSVTETTWTCTKDGETNTQQRTRTTETTTQGVVSSIARERNQFTGFNITGYSGAPTTSTSTEGPPLGSCPNGWSVTDGPNTEPVGDPTSGLEVSIDGTTWFPIG